VTEAVYQELPASEGLLAGAHWPQAEGLRDEAAEEAMASLLEAVRLIRYLKAEAGLAASRSVPVLLRLEREELVALFERERQLVEDLARAEVGFTAAVPTGALSARLAAGEIYLPIRGSVDVAAELGRLRRELEELERELGRTRKRLQNPDFRQRAPAEVVAREEERAEELTHRLEKARTRALLFEEAL
jgi:valyl-tRNA synthetase